ncbi:hypothetical protein [Qipengyuania aurantiaca]|uniref:hypothetical protein n=1 Tax=Qipengyuania aurantiaca TaxID=2867233 RepID=UPI001FFDA136|nr:hypothetical protein [Qipengyuania aurantiaca]
MGNIPDDREPTNFRPSSTDRKEEKERFSSRREDREPREPRKPYGDPDLIPDATAEIKAMAVDGLEHPSTKPVLTGAAIGIVAGLIVPVGPVLGGLAGAGVALYKRLRP